MIKDDNLYYDYEVCKILLTVKQSLMYLCVIVLPDKFTVHVFK